MDQYSIAQARDQFTQVVHKVEEGGAVEVTRRGQRVAVIVSAAEYDQWHKSKKTFGESILEFRKKYDLDNRELEEGEMSDEEFDAFWDNLRDKSPGREVEL